MKFGGLKIGSLSRPSGGLLSGRSIPKTRVNDRSWLSVLELEKPPADGPYLQRPSRQSQQVSTKDKPQELDNKSKSSGNIRQLRKLQHEKIDDWTNLSYNDETRQLGLENLEKGDKIAIVGAGITGLVLAWTLSHARPDVKIELFDTNHAVGGWMQSYQGPQNNTWEAGPRTLLPSHVGTTILTDMLKYLKRLDIIAGVPKTSPTNRKGLYYGGNTIKLPSSLRETFTFLRHTPLLYGAKLRALKDLFIPARSPSVNDESVESFISRRLGKKISERVFSAMLRGIYAGDISKLSARSVARLSKLYYLERAEHMGIIGAIASGSMKYLDSYPNEALKRLFRSLISSENSGVDCSRFSILGFPEGIQTLPKAIADDLSSRKNVRIHLDTTVSNIEPCSHGVNIKVNQNNVKADILVSTTTNPKLYSTDVAKLLKEIKYSTLAVVNVWTPEPIAKDWFGILVPRTEDERNPEKALGIIFDSSVQKAMQPLAQEIVMPEKKGSSMTVMIGGDLWTDMSDLEAKNSALNALRRIVGEFDTDKAVVKVSVQKNCIPQPEVGHSELTQKIHDEVAAVYGNRVRIAGMAVGRGVGVSDCVVDAVTIASRFTEQRKLLYPDFFFPYWQSATKPDSIL